MSCKGFLKDEAAQYAVTSIAALLAVILLVIGVRACVQRRRKRRGRKVLLPTAAQSSVRQATGSHTTTPLAYEEIGLASPTSVVNTGAYVDQRTGEGAYCEPADCLGPPSKEAPTGKVANGAAESEAKIAPEGAKGERKILGPRNSAPYSEVVKAPGGGMRVNGSPLSPTEENEEGRISEETSARPGPADCGGVDKQAEPNPAPSAVTVGDSKSKGSYIDVEFAPESQRPPHKSSVLSNVAAPTSYTTVVLGDSNPVSVDDKPDAPLPVFETSSGQDQEGALKTDDVKTAPGGTNPSRHKRSASYINIDPKALVARQSSQDNGNKEENVTSPGAEPPSVGLESTIAEAHNAGEVISDKAKGEEPTEAMVNQLDLLLTTLQASSEL